MRDRQVRTRVPGLRRPAALGILLAGLAAVHPGAAHAHPHVFVDYSATLLFEADGLAGIQFVWSLAAPPPALSREAAAA